MWPLSPKLYEINTWVWLSSLSRKYNCIIDLASVPAAEWDYIAALGMDAVWLMGVWERSAAGIAIANQNDALVASFRQALTDFKLADNVGSAYSVRGYAVDSHLGGPNGLATARAQLARRGMKVILDFVPNHVAPDHPWVREHPEYFIQGTAEDARSQPAAYVAVGGAVIACGRDPYFPAWPDVLQLNVFAPQLRQAAIETVKSIATQCDGIRCDMAMLLLNEVFERTWGSRAWPVPAQEYWAELIPAVKQLYPGFLFGAEAYWDLEWQLQQLGFDLCYDKRLYDRLEHDNAENVRLHLCADLAYQQKLVRFIENHDEPRAAAIFSPAKERAAALTTATLPGARLFHQGQFEGFKVRLPVFLGRAPAEPVDTDLQAFYEKLLAAIAAPVIGCGQWSLCMCSGWPGNESFRKLAAWAWTQREERRLIVANLSDSAAQAQVHLPWQELGRRHWQLADLLSDEAYERDGDDMMAQGLYVDLAPWNYHLLKFRSSVA